jgi:hypothetical protein
MAGPIDEGAPVWTSRANGVVTGSNIPTAARIWLFHEVAYADYDWTIYVNNATGIHDQTEIRSAVTTDWDVLGGHQPLNLHFQAPIGYKDRSVNRVLADLIFHQAHAGCGVIRMLPAADHGINQWTPSGGSPHYANVDEPVSDPNVSDSLATAIAGRVEEFDLDAMPSNALIMHEVVVSLLGGIDIGTDSGMAFGIQLKHPTLGDLSRLLYADMIYDMPTIHVAAVKLEALDVDFVDWAGAFISVTASRGSAGASPNPFWYMVALELLGYYEVSDILTVDLESFTDLDSEFAAWILDFDLTSGTLLAAVMDVLAHAPHLFLYVDYRGALRCGRVVDYASVGSPLDISGMIQEVKRGPYRYTERTATVIDLKWDVEVNHSSAGASTDPENGPPPRKARRGKKYTPDRGYEDAKELDRHFCRDLATMEKIAAA